MPVLARDFNEELSEPWLCAKRYWLYQVWDALKVHVSEKEADRGLRRFLQKNDGVGGGFCSSCDGY